MAIYQLKPLVTKVTNLSIYLKQLRRQVELVEELEAHVPDVLEEQVGLTSQAWVPVLVPQLALRVVLPVLATLIFYATTLNFSSFVRLSRPNPVC